MNNCSINSKKSYSHLSIFEREEIGLLKAEGYTLQEIAIKIDRHKSTISRELRRNQPDNNIVRYRAHRAHQRALERQKNAAQKDRLKCNSIRGYVERKLKKGWSPELIAGRLSIDKPEFTTNHESIYQYIYNERPDLAVELVHGRKKRKKRNPLSKKHTSRIPNRTSIADRPDSIANRDSFGHWETDTAVSRQSTAALQPIIERVSRFIRLSKIPDKTARSMSNALCRRLGRLPPEMVRTITYDNGTENAEHERTNDKLGTESYFCNPYHSWEKGSVENVIGIIRRYLPKKTNFSIITDERIRQIETLINNRPRKCLGYKTPREVFTKALVCCT